MCLFPDSCLRGLPNETYTVEENGRFFAAVKLFYENGRKDNSINWEDNDSVLNFTLSQTKDDDEFQFKYGVARLQKKIIDDKKKNPNVTDILSYNRDPLENNEFHGNIRIDTENKTISKMIASSLAIECEIIMRNEN